MYVCVSVCGYLCSESMHFCTCVYGDLVSCHEVSVMQINQMNFSEKWVMGKIDMHICMYVLLFVGFCVSENVHFCSCLYGDWWVFMKFLWCKLIRWILLGNGLWKKSTCIYMYVCVTVCGFLCVWNCAFLFMFVWWLVSCREVSVIQNNQMKFCMEMVYG